MWNRWRSTRHRYFNPRPREGGRPQIFSLVIHLLLFQSTPPRGGATRLAYVDPLARLISIHAPARGGDLLRAVPGAAAKSFQSTPPRGGATGCRGCACPRRSYFNPRPREGGRPVGVVGVHRSVGISIHAPARGGDHSGLDALRQILVFQSTPPRGGATFKAMSHGYRYLFQSTPPRGGATAGVAALTGPGSISIHAPARGGDTGDAGL